MLRISVILFCALAGCALISDADREARLAEYDQDGDGAIDHAYGGADCDDSDPERHPNAEEICDGVDNDCDGTIDEGLLVFVFADADGDGFGDVGAPALACGPGDGFVDDASDCDDGDPEVHPDAVEVCDGVDNDCSGGVDDGLLGLWFTDADGDGYGGDGAVVLSCEGSGDLVARGGDCDDTDAAVNPGAIELCDGIDNDCSGAVDDSLLGVWYVDADGDGYGDPANRVEACDGADDLVADASDCDDDDDGVHPGATEVCDGVDQDCDGSVDEGVLATFFADADGDGYGDPDRAIQACEAGEGVVEDDTDCDDREASVHPGATETCDERDEDCDGLVDEGAPGDTLFYRDADGDGFGDGSDSQLACAAPSGFVALAGDCDDDAPDVHPGAVETCSGVDDDCNGAVDDVLFDGRDVSCP